MVIPDSKVFSHIRKILHVKFPLRPPFITISVLMATSITMQLKVAIKTPYSPDVTIAVAELRRLTLIRVQTQANMTQTAVKNIAFHRILKLNLTFRILVNTHFQK